MALTFSCTRTNENTTSVHNSTKFIHIELDKYVWMNNNGCTKCYRMILKCNVRLSMGQKKEFRVVVCMSAHTLRFNNTAIQLIRNNHLAGVWEERKRVEMSTLSIAILQGWFNKFPHYKISFECVILAKPTISLSPFRNGIWPETQ